MGLGWNRVEYEALGKDFTSRGRRADDQVRLLRRLWTEPVVTFDAADEHVVGAGLAPMPVQRPIPVWFGGQSPAAYRRVGRLADGWFPQVRPGADLDAARQVVDQAAVAAGRDPAEHPHGGPGELDRRRRDAAFRTGTWREAGASHLSVNTMGAALAGADGHLAALGQVAEALGLTQG